VIIATILFINRRSFMTSAKVYVIVFKSSKTSQSHDHGFRAKVKYSRFTSGSRYELGDAVCLLGSVRWRI
jgi:hypothetical protein